jgi:hypothetical protein
MALQALVGGGSSSQNGVDLVADLAITMAPVMEQMGVVTAKDLDAAAQHARMHAEVQSNGSGAVEGVTKSELGRVSHDALDGPSGKEPLAWR